MLSPQAWNAFLKTLEEPPPHTIFVLATTEAQKVLPTVVDRCHRFDFRRPTVEQIAAVLAPRRRRRRGSRSRPTRVALLARHATGSLPRRARHARAARHLQRRARSRSRTCSRCSASPTPTCSSARSTPSPRTTPRGALLAAAALRRAGRDLGQFMRDLEAHARELLVVQTLGEVPAELRVTPERDARLAEQAGARRPRATSCACSSCSPTRWRPCKDGADARTQLELALVEGREPAGRPVGAGAAGAHRRARGGAGRPRARARRRRAPAPRRAAAAPARAAARARGARPGARGRRPSRAADGGRAAPAEPPPRRAPRGAAGAADAERAAAPPPRSRSPTRPRRPRRRSRPAPEGLAGMTAVWPAVRRRRLRRERDARRRALATPAPVELRGRELVGRLRPRRTASTSEGRRSPEHRAVVEDARPRPRGPPAARRCSSCASSRPTSRAAAPPRLGGRAGRALRGQSSTPRRSCRSRRRRGRRGLMPQPPNMQQMMQAGPEDAAGHGRGAGGSSRTRSVEASAGGGMVTVKVSRRPRRSSRSRSTPEAIDPEDPELLQDMVLAAVNEGAARRAGARRSRKLGGLTGGLDLGSARAGPLGTRACTPRPSSA